MVAGNFDLVAKRVGKCVRMLCFFPTKLLDLQPERDSFINTNEDVCVCVIACMCVYMCVCVIASVSHLVSLCLSLFLSQSLCFCLALAFLSHSLCVSVSFSLCLFLSLSVGRCLHVPTGISVIHGLHLIYIVFSCYFLM